MSGVDTEGALLARIADGDEAARSVLADWWIEHGEVARGSFVHVQLQRAERPDDRNLQAAEAAMLVDHAERWQAVARRYPPELLRFERGFQAPPLVAASDAPLSRDLYRLSPLVYRELGRRYTGVIEARATSWAGDRWRVLLEVIHPRRERVVDEHPGTTEPTHRALHRDNLARVMPWGIDVRQLMRARSCPGIPCAVSVALALCERLAPPHAHGVAHGQLFPYNVLLLPTGAVAAIRLLEPVTLREPEIGEQFAYRAPEQVAGQVDADPRTDVFQIGALACWLATGVHPVQERRTELQALTALRAGRFVIAPLPPGLDAVIRRALAPHPGDRFASAAELANALRTDLPVDVGPHVIADAIRELV